MPIRTIVNRRCDCGNVAVALKVNGPVCARCLRIEEMLIEEGRKPEAKRNTKHEGSHIEYKVYC